MQASSLAGPGVGRLEREASVVSTEFLPGTSAASCHTTTSCLAQVEDTSCSPPVRWVPGHTTSILRSEEYQEAGNKQPEQPGLCLHSAEFGTKSQLRF